MYTKNRNLALISIPLVFIIFCVGTSIGSSNINLMDTVQILLHKMFSLPLTSEISPKEVSIIWSLRVPRVLLAFLVGGSLAVSGAVVQSVLKNELASPYTLGVSSGASLGAGIVIILGVNISFLGNLTLPLIGFVFGLLTVYGVIVFSSKIDKTMSNNTIILSGMVFSLFVSAVLTTLTSLFHEDLQSITLWQMGSFSMKGFSSVKAIIPFILIGLVGVLIHTREMDILTFGEEQAKAVGVDTTKVKKRLFIFSAILTGSSVALSGTIGFVDLIAPHIVRRIFGSKHIYVIPMSFIFGGTLMVITDLIARTIISPAELPVGAVTALIGAPFFVYIYFGKGKRA